jgi:hypothetical protein
MIATSGFVRGASLDGHSIRGGDRTVLVFRWHREAPFTPEREGFEGLSLELPEAAPGGTYELPSGFVRAAYGMGSPPHRQGSRAHRLRGTVRIHSSRPEGLRVRLMLDAAMIRSDAPDRLAFRERIRGG